jgi:HAD superfamily hydrolase (TIGR01509 family)
MRHICRQERIKMAAINERAIEDHVDPGTIAAAPVRQERVVMPSSRHSVLAKAARYRTEPHRVGILVSEPLVAVVHGLHAEHTVRESVQGLVCTCERFERGESTCAHVLVVEHQRSLAASNAAVAEFATELAEVRFVEVVRAAERRDAVVSASKNCQEVLIAAGIEHLFEVRVDGVVAERAGMRGKPAPDMFLGAPAALGVQPAQSAIFEDAIAGVQAGHAGGFGWVVGVDRVGQADALRRHGADRVVADLSELLPR